ncbi:unnamed protein product [Anisakis simplex]|uniref:PDZ domain-containing protein n=1 Tax=Anisakis simplex TaxID=6269 RepID=A0A0M3JRN4_ANISI|nr:unnamed protein product [Anisakis simplex]
MSLLINVLLERQSTSYNYGFTIRHTTVYPFEDGYDSCMMGDYDTNEAYDNEIPVNSAVISRVEPLSCAYNAGLRCGDRILCINDEAISDLSYEQICDIIRTSDTFISESHWIDNVKFYKLPYQ